MSITLPDFTRRPAAPAAKTTKKKERKEGSRYRAPPEGYTLYHLIWSEEMHSAMRTLAMTRRSTLAEEIGAACHRWLTIEDHRITEQELADVQATHQAEVDSLRAEIDSLRSQLAASRTAVEEISAVHERREAALEQQIEEAQSYQPPERGLLGQLAALLTPGQLASFQTLAGTGEDKTAKAVHTAIKLYLDYYPEPPRPPKAQHQIPPAPAKKANAQADVGVHISQ